jgi:REP element-mobilizing transposase RayT
MARKPRAEVEGGLYHLIARGNNRQNIFHSDEDFKKFLSLLEAQKAKLGFYLYAYCLMSNHFHLALERQAEPVGRIMQRVLTGYSQYYNGKYRKIGHVFQGRHKAILCQADRYLAELVRYIHLNPVRAKVVRKAERYRWSSQRAYLDIERSELVDVDPVLRLFGARRQKARENFAEFVAAGARLGHQDEFYSVSNGSILGSEEFVDGAIHHVWERDQTAPRAAKKQRGEFDPQRLLRSVEEVFGISAQAFTGQTKQAAAVRAKEAVIIAGRQLGVSFRRLSEIVGLDDSTISRRFDKARARMKDDDEIKASLKKVLTSYDRP